MPELQYRTEEQRVRDAELGIHRPIMSGDQFRPRTEAQRVAEAQAASAQPLPAIGSGLMRDPVHGHLVGVEQQPLVPPSPPHDEYPRWITPNESQIVVSTAAGTAKDDTGDFETENEIQSRGSDTADTGLKKDGDNLIVPRGAVVSVPGFEHHVRRHDGAIQVLVHNEDEEKLAMGERVDPKPGFDVSPAERLAAEQAYEHEHRVGEHEDREQRIVEIIAENRKRELEQAEKELEALRERAKMPEPHVPNADSDPLPGTSANPT